MSTSFTNLLNSLEVVNGEKQYQMDPWKNGDRREASVKLLNAEIKETAEIIIDKKVQSFC